MKNLQKGFTLVELMIVIAVIGILATMAVFGAGKAQQSARDARRVQFISGGLRGALENYYGAYQTYPPSSTCAVLLSTLVISNTDPGKASGGTLCAGTYGVSAFTGGDTYSFTFTRESGGSIPFTNPQ